MLISQHDVWVRKDAFTFGNTLLRLDVDFGSPPAAAAFITTVMSYLCDSVAYEVQFDVLEDSRGMHFVPERKYSLLSRLC